MVGKPVCGLGADVGDFWGMDGRESAKEKARCWLGWLANNGRIDWSSFGPDGLRAAPSPDLYCDVGGGTVETDNGEHEPFSCGGRPPSAIPDAGRRPPSTTGQVFLFLRGRGWKKPKGSCRYLFPWRRFPIRPGGRRNQQKTCSNAGSTKTRYRECWMNAIGVLADHIRPVDGLRDALGHLMDNAVRHSGERRGVFTLGRVGDRMVARVEDQGVGMCSTSRPVTLNERSVEDVFEPGLTPGIWPAEGACFHRPKRQGL